MNGLISEQLNHRLLSDEEEREMVDNNDIEGLVKHNLRLVSKIARKYDVDNPSLDFDDIYQYGVKGLIEAAKKFEPGQGAKFSTYATYWIHARISKGYRKDRYNIRHSYAWDNEELDERKIECTSLNKKMREKHGSSKYIDYVESDKDFYNEMELKDLVEDLLSLVSERKQKILRMRFGLFDGRDWCLHDIGPKIGLSRERVRQLQNQALKRIKEEVQSLRDEIKI